VGLCGFTIAMEDYALRYPVVEVQQTFYQPPSNNTMQRWLTATPRTLEFTMKAWQLVTHPATSPTYRRNKHPIDDPAGCGFFRESAIVDFGYRRSLECARLLGATAMLFQCPASFAPTRENMDNLRGFFRRIERPKGLRMLWEPRGPKWVAARRDALALCAELDLVHVVDPFVTPPERGHPVYWRLHGITGARHRYTDEELVQLKQLLLDAKAPEPAYVMFNEIPRAADALRFLAHFR
jgi:uncharacterized protein YecE (DUF72 family)